MKTSISRVAGEAVRSCVDAPRTEAEHTIARRRLLDRVARERRASRKPYVFAIAAALSLVAVVIAVVVLRPEADPPMTFTVAAGDVSAAPGTYFAPAGQEPVVLRFSEGSQVRLEPASRARIAQTTSRGASLLLETGRAHLEVEARPGADWSVIAGPYAVRIVGTAFSVGWDAATGTFEVEMERGTVHVRGPGIEDGVEVTGTQHFVIRDPHRAKAEASAAPPAEPTAAAPTIRGEVEPDNAALVPSAASPVGSTKEKAPRVGTMDEVEPPSWPQLAAAGKYRDIVKAAEERGIDGVVDGAGLADLWAFADAARVTGQSGHARRALLAVRSRFPGTPNAASAAFLLGRMADGGGAGSAVQWYDRYLAEAPGGAFAPEAHGRRMVALQRSGNVEAGRRAAETYLKQFPAGPYAPVARDILSR